MFWQTTLSTLKSLYKGIQLTLQHLFQARVRRPALPVWHPDYFRYAHGRVTLQYPHEQIPVPDNGRYRLHNEIDDCIVCDKCAKICPVDCIEIEAIKSPVPIGTTSDGTVKRLYAAKFNIDMAKCCYCGLCTTVCPTECLTMSKTFDYTEADVYDLLYLFGNLSKEEIAEKQALWVQYQAEKEAQPQTQNNTNSRQSVNANPVFKPKPQKTATTSPKSSEETEEKPSPKPVFKPKMKPQTSQENTSKAVIKPKLKAPVKPTEETETEEKNAAKPVIKPKIKPIKPISPEDKPADSREETTPQTSEEKKAKPVIKPKIPPKKNPDA
ncbi:NADH-quinone oxidoreductase subunit I [Thermonema lapsum]|uniref:NADH-quinone oxidoreductase subunit I n=1 Tax=Thermonema lapsum TaxID=28195 RepID=A0A846MSG9_9BACT|nr:4Fe-4S binding protein [Thermonema lapsum]NIK74389.1 NADH-quinone oxidoreductase subunit I [Thermonema lapsum]